jgi:putative transposase
LEIGDGLRGQRNDIAFAHEQVDGFTMGATIGDMGYDADQLCHEIAKTGAEFVIPSETARSQRAYDIDLYKERNIIERFFNKLKQFRRVASRYEKLLVNFIGFVRLAAIVIWLKLLLRHHALVQPIRGSDLPVNVRRFGPLGGLTAALPCSHASAGDAISSEAMPEIARNLRRSTLMLSWTPSHDRHKNA